MARTQGLRNHPTANQMARVLVGAAMTGKRLDHARLAEELLKIPDPGLRNAVTAATANWLVSQDEKALAGAINQRLEADLHKKESEATEGRRREAELRQEASKAADRQRLEAERLRTKSEAMRGRLEAKLRRREDELSREKTRIAELQRVQTAEDARRFRSLLDNGTLSLGNRAHVGALSGLMSEWDADRVERLFNALDDRDLEGLAARLEGADMAAFAGREGLGRGEKAVLFDSLASKLSGGNLGRLSKALTGGEKGHAAGWGDKAALGSSIARKASEAARLDYIRTVAPETWLRDPQTLALALTYNEQPRAVGEVLASLRGPAVDKALASLNDDQLAEVMKSASPVFIAGLGQSDHDVRQSQSIIDAAASASAGQKARLFQAGVKALDRMRQTWERTSNNRPALATPGFVDDAAKVLGRLRGGDSAGVDQVLGATDEGKAAIARYEDTLVWLGRSTPMPQSNGAAGCELVGSSFEEYAMPSLENSASRFGDGVRVGWYAGGDLKVGSLAFQQWARNGLMAAGAWAGARIPGSKVITVPVGAGVGYALGRAVPSELRFRYTCLGGKLNPNIPEAADGASNQFWVVDNLGGPLTKVDERLRQRINDGLAALNMWSTKEGVEVGTALSAAALAAMNGATLEGNVDINWQTPRVSVDQRAKRTKVYLSLRLGVSFEGKSPQTNKKEDKAPDLEPVDASGGSVSPSPEAKVKDKSGWGTSKIKYNVTVQVPIDANLKDKEDLVSGSFPRQESAVLRLLADNIGKAPITTAFEAARIASGYDEAAGQFGGAPATYGGLLEKGYVINVRTDRGRNYTMAQSGKPRSGLVPAFNGGGGFPLIQAGAVAYMGDDGIPHEAENIRITATALGGAAWGKNGRPLQLGITGRVGVQLQVPLARDRQGRIDAQAFQAQLEDTLQRNSTASNSQSPVGAMTDINEGNIDPEAKLLSDYLLKNPFGVALAVYKDRFERLRTSGQIDHWTPEESQAIEDLLGRGERMATQRGQVIPALAAEDAD